MSPIQSPLSLQRGGPHRRPSVVRCQKSLPFRLVEQGEVARRIVPDDVNVVVMVVMSAVYKDRLPLLRQLACRRGWQSSAPETATSAPPVRPLISPIRSLWRRSDGLRDGEHDIASPGVHTDRAGRSRRRIVHRQFDADVGHGGKPKSASLVCLRLTEGSIGLAAPDGAATDSDAGCVPNDAAERQPSLKTHSRVRRRPISALIVQDVVTSSRSPNHQE